MSPKILIHESLRHEVLGEPWDLLVSCDYSPDSTSERADGPCQPTIDTKAIARRHQLLLVALLAR